MVGNFNPRSREGSDSNIAVSAARANISIHAPAKGATTSVCWVFDHAGDFNPRSREGSDRLFLSPVFFPMNFNPRSREGSDILYSPVLRMDGNFNPRSREGSD